MKTFTLLKDLPASPTRATRKLFLLSGDGTSELVVSSSVGDPAKKTCETYFFPSDLDGTVQNWTEKSYSARGLLDPVEVLTRAGWVNSPLRTFLEESPSVDVSDEDYED